MKTWAYAAGFAAAVGALALVTLALRRSQYTREGEEIPSIIADCQERVHRIERELQNIRATAGV